MLELATFRTRLIFSAPSPTRQRPKMVSGLSPMHQHGAAAIERALEKGESPRKGGAKTDEGGGKGSGRMTPN